MDGILLFPPLVQQSAGFTLQLLSLRGREGTRLLPRQHVAMVDLRHLHQILQPFLVTFAQLHDRPPDALHFGFVRRRAVKVDDGEYRRGVPVREDRFDCGNDVVARVGRADPYELLCVEPAIFGRPGIFARTP